MKEKNIKEPLVPISSHQLFFQKNVALEKVMELSCNAKSEAKEFELL